MTRRPHVSRGPYLPPARPARHWRQVVELALGAVAIVLLAWLAFVMLPVLSVTP